MDQETYDKACAVLPMLSDLLDQHLCDAVGERTAFVLVTVINDQIQIASNYEEASEILNAACSAVAEFGNPQFMPKETEH